LTGNNRVDRRQKRSNAVGSISKESAVMPNNWRKCRDKLFGIAAVAIAVCSGCQPSEPMKRDLPSLGDNSGGSWSESSRVGDTLTIRRSSFTHTAFNPTEEERERLVVVWGRPKVIHSSDIRNGKHVWRVGEKGHDPKVRISGSVFLRSEDGELRLLDGAMAICIMLATEPERAPAWTQPPSMLPGEYNPRHPHTYAEEIVTNDEGYFEWILPLDGRIKRLPGKSSSYQIGLSIGEKHADKAKFETGSPVLPQSISKVTIPGPPELSPTMQAINGAPAMEQVYCNPAMLVRAVNHLHGLEEGGARRAMEEFLTIARQTRQGYRDPQNIDTSHDECVSLIIQALYEPREGVMRVPVRGGAPSDDEDHAKWPRMPLAFQDDVPFVVGFVFELGVYSGYFPGPTEHLEWANENAKFRKGPLCPADDPLAAADRLCARPEASVFLSKPGALSGIRKQAWTMIAHLVEAPIRPEACPEYLPETYNTPDLDDEETWRKFKAAAAKHRIAWSETEQNYVEVR
jgi:hypothetical protein